MQVTIVGAGLAGSEAAWQLAQAGLEVELVDMKPDNRPAAHTSEQFAELVCSNSLRSGNLQNAVGLIKEEMRRLGSLVMDAALATRVPAGDALAVDRQAFAEHITHALAAHPRIKRRCAALCELPAATAGEHVIATGPLTSPKLGQDIVRVTGSSRLYFYDAIAPIIAGDSIDRAIVFAASRYGKGAGDDYLNCPMNQTEYEAFLAALLAGECMPLHSFEEPKYFQGCMPVEVVGASGADALRFGAMKPVGLTDPRTGRRPYAVVQLRQEDKAGLAFNLVGFQTKLMHPAQRHVFRLIPGLAQAEFLRLGAIHRNTFLDSPSLLDARMRLVARPNLRFAGQLTGVEGYVESAAHGLLTARLLASDLGGRPLVPPPAESALGALYRHVRGELLLSGRPYEPQNVNWSMVPPPPPPPAVRKNEVKAWRLRRAVTAFESWAKTAGVALAPPTSPGGPVLDDA